MNDIKTLVIFLLVCAWLSTGTLVARQLRLESERTALYARIIVACGNGYSFTLGAKASVMCYPVHTH